MLLVETRILRGVIFCGFMFVVSVFFKEFVSLNHWVIPVAIYHSTTKYLLSVSIFLEIEAHDTKNEACVMCILTSQYLSILVFVLELWWFFSLFAVATLVDFKSIFRTLIIMPFESNNFEFFKVEVNGLMKGPFSTA